MAFQVRPHKYSWNYFGLAGQYLMVNYNLEHVGLSSPTLYIEKQYITSYQGTCLRLHHQSIHFNLLLEFPSSNG